MADGYGRTAYGNEKTKRRTGRTAAYRDKGGRKRGKVESNRGASTDLRETRMHEDASAVGICFYYKVCKWCTRNTAIADPCLCLSIPSYGGAVINCIVKVRVTLLHSGGSKIMLNSSCRHRPRCCNARTNDYGTATLFTTFLQTYYCESQ